MATLTLLQLQNLIKRDPESYRSEFEQQYQHYQSHLTLFKVNPSQQSKELMKLIMFLAHVTSCYGNSDEFSQGIISLLKEHSSNLCRDIRLTLCQALMLLRRKQQVETLTVLQVFFDLFKCEDKALRKQLQNFVINDIKKINLKQRDVRINTSLQNFVYSQLTNSHPFVVKAALSVLIELYRKHIWDNERSVNVISSACFSKFFKVVIAALSFFLGSDETLDTYKHESDSDNEPAKKTEKEILFANRFNKKTSKRKRKAKKDLRTLKKVKKSKNKPAADFSALYMIHDPQEFAEKLFKQANTTNEGFNIKLLFVNLVSKLIGIHKLFLLNFYPFIQRFLQPHHAQVTKMLLFTAQACHELVPPETLHPILMTIANNFITERNSFEVMAVGLNSVREICSRCPLAIPDVLLQDLIEYKSHKNKSVVSAARNAIQISF